MIAFFVQRIRGCARSFPQPCRTSTSGRLVTVPLEKAWLEQRSDIEVCKELILVMMYEYLQGDDSYWKPYFDILPDTFDTLMYWGNEELLELQGCAVVHKIGKEAADERFRQVIVPIVRVSHRRFLNAPPSSYLMLSFSDITSRVRQPCFCLNHRQK
jgi:hypothetical protein